MKKLLIVVGVIALVSIGFITYVRLTTKATIYSNLTDRARDYLKDKRSVNDRDWQKTKIDQPVNTFDKPSFKKVDDPKCFSITVPIPSSEARREADCQYRIFLTDPVGFSIVFRRPVEANSMDDVADVSMRRLYTEQYTEKKIKINDREFYIFKKKDGAYERSAFLLQNKQLFVFSIVVQTNENLDRKFDETLQSIKIYNE